MKQDLNGVRTAQDLERKYDLSAIAGTKKAVQQAEKTLTKVENETSNLLESLIINLDGVILSGSISLWFYNATPTLTNSPASSWTTNELKNAHLNDLYYDRETGYVYKFVSGYKWEKQLDGQLVQSMALTNASIDTTDHERQIFFETTPTPPYNNGDWLVKENGDLYICQITKESNQTYHPDDFIISSQYTYGTEANHKGNVLTVTSGRITKVEVGVDELNSTMTETVDGLTKAQSQILQNTNNINLKVSKNDVINQINVSTEGVSIKAGKITLESYTTINHGFSIDTSGNMTCQNATIKGSSVKLADNTEIIGGKGLLTNFQFNSRNVNWGGNTIAGYYFLGYNADYSGAHSNWLEIDAEIPTNFEITNAYINFYHIPVNWAKANSSSNQLGYVKNVKVYKVNSPLNITVNGAYLSEYETSLNYSLTPIDGAFNGGSFTANGTSTGQTQKTNDIKSVFMNGTSTISGSYKLVIKTANSVPSINIMDDSQDPAVICGSDTGYCYATLHIIGYKK